MIRQPASIAYPPRDRPPTARRVRKGPLGFTLRELFPEIIGADVEERLYEAMNEDSDDPQNATSPAGGRGSSLGLGVALEGGR